MRIHIQIHKIIRSTPVLFISREVHRYIQSSTSEDNEANSLSLLTCGTRRCHVQYSPSVSSAPVLPRGPWQEEHTALAR